MKQTKKELIMEAAFNSFVEKGYENTNIRQLCKDVHIEPPTIYYYFESKKGLFFATAASLSEKYDTLLKAQTFLEQEKRPQDKLFDLFKFNLFYAKDNPMDLRFFLRYNMFPPEEIAQELKDFQKLMLADKNEIEKKIFDECIQNKLIAQDRLEEVRKTYDMFVMNHCFDTVMYDHCPTEEALPDIWKYFAEYKILISK